MRGGGRGEECRRSGTLLPRDFPGQGSPTPPEKTSGRGLQRASYNGPLLYTEVKYENSSQLVFDLVRQWGSGTNRKWVAASHFNTYDPTKTITFQVGPSTAKVYYGSTCIINTTHGTNALYVYPQGAYPHYEYQNEDDTDNAVSALDNVRVRRLSGFEAP